MSGKVISVAQQKGGSGKSTVAAHLAVALRLQGYSVALVDIDPQRSLSFWFETRQQRKRGSIDLAFCDAEGWELSRISENLIKDHDFVLVDCPPHAETDSRVAIRAADLVLMPVQPSILDIRACEKTKQLADREGRQAMAVFNRLAPHQDVSEIGRTGLNGLAVPFFTVGLGNRVAYPKTMAKGLTVLEVGGAAKAGDEVRSLSVEIVQALT